MLEKLNLLTQINNSYVLTKQCKIYFHLNEFNFFEKTNNSNLFQLTILDKFFFLRQILISDSFYLLAIIDILHIVNEPITTKEIKRLFVNYLKNELDLNLKYSQKSATKKKIIEVKTRVSTWKKPLVYLEHIIEPRINWLLDLGILELTLESREKKYYFTEVGQKLFSVLSNLFEKKLNKQLVINSLIHNHYIKLFNFIFNLNKKEDITSKVKINQYLFEAFKIFKTAAPRKIAASQAIDYVCLKFFLEDDLIVEYEELKEYLQSHNNTFSLDWFKTENDGALYLKK